MSVNSLAAVEKPLEQWQAHILTLLEQLRAVTGAVQPARSSQLALQVERDAQIAESACFCLEIKSLLFACIALFFIHEIDQEVGCIIPALLSIEKS